MLQNYQKTFSPNEIVPGCPSWLQFKLLIDLIFEPVHFERRRSLPFSLLSKPVNSIIRKISNSIRHFHCLAGNSTIIFFNNPGFFSVCEVFISSRSSTVRVVMFTYRVTSFIKHVSASCLSTNI